MKCNKCGYEIKKGFCDGDMAVCDDCHKPEYSVSKMETELLALNAKYEKFLVVLNKLVNILDGDYTLRELVMETGELLKELESD